MSFVMIDTTGQKILIFICVKFFDGVLGKQRIMGNFLKNFPNTSKIFKIQKKPEA